MVHPNGSKCHPIVAEVDYRFTELTQKQIISGAYDSIEIVQMFWGAGGLPLRRSVVS